MLFSILSIVLATTLASSVFAAPPKKAPAQVITSCTKPKTAALTFDDGPWWYMYDVSKMLVSHGAVGTFFFNGDNFECIYSDANVKRVKYAYSKGHQIASHTWGHKNLSTLAADEIHDEMWRVEEALMKITGAYPAFMRPPFGAYNDLVRQVSGIRGQKIAMWDFDTGDSVGKNTTEQMAAIDELVASHPKTINSLAHEVHATSVYTVLPYMIDELQSAGYKLVTLAQCLGQQPYQWVGTPQVRDSTWHC